MKKWEILKLKTTTQQSCSFILNFYQTLSIEGIRQKENYYTQIDYLATINCQKEII